MHKFIQIIKIAHNLQNVNEIKVLLELVNDFLE